ncbi:MAG: flavin reductase family protein [Lachnospiraceae bacterium]|nr:flavin reductase family protein [Lachnospiraceae bacterium]
MSREIWKSGNMLYPLPAVMVSCARPGERPNILTVAWAGTICSTPAMVSISVRPERYSYNIIRETGEFVMNLTTKKLARAADYCGVRSGRDVDKFQELHLSAAPAAFVAAPLIEESPVNMECRVREVLELGSHHMFVSEVLGVDVDPRYLDEKGKLCLKDAELMAYSHGTYFALGEELGSFGFSVRRKQRGKGRARGTRADGSARGSHRGSGVVENK